MKKLYEYKLSMEDFSISKKEYNVIEDNHYYIRVEETLDDDVIFHRNILKNVMENMLGGKYEADYYFFSFEDNMDMAREKFLKYLKYRENRRMLKSIRQENAIKDKVKQAVILLETI